RHYETQDDEPARGAAMERAERVPPHALCRDLGIAVAGLGSDEVDRQLTLLSLRNVIELVTKREVLAVLGVLEFVGPENVGRKVPEELARDLGGVNVDRLDLLFNLLLLIGEVLVDVAVPLNIRLCLQQVERLLHLLAQSREVEPEAVINKHGEVTGSRFEGVDVLHQEQRLQQAVREDCDFRAWVRQVLLSLENGALSCRL